MDELMPIGEFSERSGLSPNRLRTYAAGGLLTPAAVDAASGYRYYAPGQLREARLIDTLRRAGMPLAEIGALLRRPSAERLDAWARRVVDDAALRRQALELARRLLAVEAGQQPPTHEYTTGEGRAMFRFTTAGRSETGHVRDSNQDAILSGERLAVVADGMGGHATGEVASAIAVGLVEAAFTGRSADELQAAVRAANRAIWDRATSPELAGMGTTICAAGLTDDGRLAVVHVGDSRAYLLHDGSLTPLTEDHSVTADLVRRGELSEEEALSHPHHGVLTRALGVGPDVELEVGAPPVVAGDRLLLCTDGLFNEVPVDEIESLMTATEGLAASADTLVELAVSRGGRDNVSVVVAEISG